METLETILERNQQTILLDHLKNLSGEKLEYFRKQLEAVDWDYITALTKEYVLQKPVTTIPDDLSPAPFFPLVPKTDDQKALYAKAKEVGKELIAAGKVAALTVAGGQGTRLGYNAPKGTFPITPVRKKTLFQYFAESLARVSEKYGRQIPWLIMTSELNDADTKAFFRKNEFFGLPEESVHFFTQGTMPAIRYDGKCFPSEPGSLALAPDGHGGTLLALRKSGLLDAMKQAGVEYFSYFQVDNPLVPVVNPFFIGLHALEQSEMSSIMLAKTNAYEKLGNFCITNGKLQIIEYSDMPNELAERTNPDGTLSFLAGSPAIHVITLAFVERLTAAGRLELPWHRADKKVAYLENGEIITPEAPNAVKLEAFIFDALPLAGRTMILEADRKECFAPTKNKTGVDSVESCREMLAARDARRLRLAGIQVPEGAVVELSPRDVFDDEDAANFFKNLVPTAYGR
ncbi:MAG: UDPGP type 1 family protein [Lentisphaeria bacterium]|nr:UDPGP type 1 family protein [Lentisphaeria bacterium]